MSPNGPLDPGDLQARPFRAEKLTLSPGGTITGTPTSTGTYDFTVQVTDSTTPTPETATANLSILAVDVAENWSGYVVGNGPYTSVTGTFTVTSLDSGDSPSEAMAEWVGIDGANNSSLIQAGVSEQIDPANTNDFTIQPWWEILPYAATNITTMTVAPGNQVTVTITELSTGEWSITLTDDTTGVSFNIDQTYTGPATSAEWIVEAPMVNNTQTVLAPYSPDIEFTGLGVNGTQNGLDEVVMVQNGVVVSFPSALTSVGFNVAYGDAPAPNP